MKFATNAMIKDGSGIPSSNSPSRVDSCFVSLATGSHWVKKVAIRTSKTGQSYAVFSVLLVEPEEGIEEDSTRQVKNGGGHYVELPSLLFPNFNSVVEKINDLQGDQVGVLLNIKFGLKLISKPAITSAGVQYTRTDKAIWILSIS